MKRTYGTGDDDYITQSKNAFRFPKDPNAVIPQAKAPVFVDKRSRYATRDILVKKKGVKNKNVLKQKHIEELDKAMKEAELRASGNERDNQVIDLNKIVTLDKYGNIDVDKELDDIEMENFSLSENKKKNKNKKIKEGMFIDEDNNVRSKTGRTRKKRGKHSKSHYIINY
jgi:hypothetical protein